MYKYFKYQCPFMGLINFQLQNNRKYMIKNRQYIQIILHGEKTLSNVFI